MSSISEEADPSESRAAARNAVASPLPGRVTFNRFELNRILNLYGRMVADGEWRDYAIDFLRDRAVFSVFRRASEVPIYRIEKDPRLARKQGIYSVISPSARCIITVSSQRPNLKPTLGWVPIISKPHRLCTPIDPALAESPITAIIWR